MPPEESTPPRRALPAWLGQGAGALLVLAGCLFAYAPALAGQLLWDDASHLTPPRLAGAAGLRLIWTQLGATQQYYPVLHSAFWLEHALWGDRLWAYHLANVLLHVLAASLFALLLQRLAGAAGPRPVAVGAAWLAAALFAFHPVAVESVAWISEQKNTLSLVFYLLAALAYLRFDDSRRWGWYLAASAAFVLAVLTKSVTVTLPAALLLVLAWRRRRLPTGRELAPLGPWLLLGLAAGLLTAYVERRYVGAVGPAYDLSPVARLFLAGWVVWFYLAKLAWPADLSFIYPHWEVRVAPAWSIGVVAAGLTLALLALLARRRTAAPLLAFLFFVGSLFPALGFFNVYPFAFSYVADHWQYLASLGVFALVGAGGAPLLADRLGRPAVAAGALGLLAVLLGLSRRQAALYRDGATLYADTVRKNPTCWMAANNLGLLRAGEGKKGEAEALYRLALQLRPDFADAHNNLGNLLTTEPGQAAAATAEFERAVQLDPKMTEAQGNLGWALVNTPGRLEEGIAHLETALAGHQRDPAFALLFADLGYAAARVPARLPEAIAAYETALQLDPAHPERRNDLGVALARAGHPEAARAQFARLLAAQPNLPETHANLGGVLDELGRPAEAEQQYRAALALDPNSFSGHFNLGRLLRRRGALEEAEAELRAAVRLVPAAPAAHYSLALVLRAEGRAAEAADEFRRSGQPGPAGN